jgi:hypothetical protein
MLCISRPESMTEKLRAALSRREVAIRDFFDVDYAVRELNLRVLEPELLALVRQKLEAPRQRPDRCFAEPACRAAAAARVAAESRTSHPDFVRFDLGRAFANVAGAAAVLG